MQQYMYQRTFPIAPVDLGRIRDKVSANIQQQVWTCSQERGYIISIDKILWETATNHLSRTTGACILTIQFLAQALKPSVGSMYNGIVRNVFPEGIFVEVHTMSVLIPYSEIPEWKYKDASFVHLTADEIIRINDYIQVRITACRYKDSAYQCIGILP